MLAEQEVKGYILNTETGSLQEYYNTPEESLSDISANETEEVSMTKDSAIMPRAFTRVFHSYLPNTYSYDYDNSLFKIGMVRVDNSKNNYTSASLVFTVERSGSCSSTVTVGTTVGGEIDAIYAKAKVEFSGEVANQVTWSAGTRVETGSSVPPGQKGKVTAYVVGVYSGGTAKYIIENLATNSVTYEQVGIGALIPCTREWNLVVEIPCS